VSTRTRHAVVNTIVEVLPSLGGGPRPGVPAVSPEVEQQVIARMSSADFDAWTRSLNSVGNCARPIRLHGRSETVDAATGEVLSSYSSADEPWGVTYVRCGNRRAAECPSCSRLYAADMFHLIRCGVAGGKTVPERVGENPLVFATFTAPSFGRVHGRRGDRGRRCHPHTAGPVRCEHGRPRTCHAIHAEDDPALGQPLCGDCYDYPSQVVWQWWAPDLFRRFTIALRRELAHELAVPATRLGEVATVQYAKVAEYQVRGVVHFHALVRLDGPRTAEGFAPAPTAMTAERLAALVAHVAEAVRVTAPGVGATDPERELAFGVQLDARPVRAARRTDDPDRTLQPEQVAGYLAKYATKSAADTGVADNPHHRRIRATVLSLAACAAPPGDEPGQPAYRLLGKWVHMLGFRGHFASKSQRYSVTLGALRRARRRAQALISEARLAGRPLDLAALELDLLADDEHDTTLVIGGWRYAGTGWATEGERVLALASAARAREHAQERARRYDNKGGTRDRTR
jgi:hypothetical protein